MDIDMSNIWTIAKREYKLYFGSPAAYIVAFVIMLVLGLIFYANILYAAQQQFQQGTAPGVQVIFGPMVTLFLFFTAAVTMRLLAEEQRLGTLELLLTAPVRDWELVVGKWLGGFLFMLSIIFITIIFPIVLNRMVNPGIDQGPLLTGYLGIALFTMALVAIGVAISALFNNQIAAFFATAGVFLLLWLIGMANQATGGGNALIAYLDFGDHFYSSFYNGVIQISDIIYYLSLTALALYFGTIFVEARRWR
jgi:ABC-2 type transport system permease protein